MGLGELVIFLLVALAAVGAMVAWHWFRGQLVGSVKGLLQGEAAIPGMTPGITVRRFVEADGAWARAEMQVGLVGKPFQLDAETARGLAQLLREADAWVQEKA